MGRASLCDRFMDRFCALCVCALHCAADGGRASLWAALHCAALLRLTLARLARYGEPYAYMHTLCRPP